tara:strand:+ start:1711 stop:2103 length:393 start_codon:yes stop_codon:yes gene_type:complete
MPTKRKRIGYLPSFNVQKIITTIAKKEKLSQSKVVGILVEEALKAKKALDIRHTDYLVINRIYSNENIINNSSSNNSDLDELISDKGITYKKKKNDKSDSILYDNSDAYNKDLLDKFKQFIFFQKLVEEK